jgi:predicted MPP superfamily phosphohydrolase
MIGWILLATVGAGGACVAYGVAIERHAYRLVRRDLAILPTDGPETLSVLHLSDLHFLRRDEGKRRFLSSLPEADVTVITGDLLAEPAGVEAVVEAVRANRGRLGSWFVLGSNDYFVPRPLNPFAYLLGPSARRRRARGARRGRASDLVSALEADGWTELSNVHDEISLDGLAVERLGLDDAHIRFHDLRVVPRRSPERFGFAVMHSPDSVPEAVACGYPFVVAGHTHGGQVRMPVIGALVTNSSLPRRVASGLLRMGDAFVHVSPGLGTGKYAPFRFLCRPEATLLTLRRANDQAQYGQ